MKETKKSSNPNRLEIQLAYKPHAGQKLFHASKAKIRILACGRRWGKDRACVMEIVRLYPSLLARSRDDKTLIPRVHIWCVGPTYALTDQFWRELKALVPKEIRVGEPNESRREMNLIGGGLIEVKSADEPERLVSVGLDLLVVTEAAIIDASAWQESLVPALASPSRAGLAILNGTPKGMNWFHSLWMQSSDPTSGIEAWNWPTHASLEGSFEEGKLIPHPMGNPYMNLEDLEHDRRQMPERAFRQEFLGEWIASGGSVFQNVDRCIQGALEAPRHGERYYFGLDLGRKEDFTVLIVVNSDNHVVEFKRWRRLDWSVQKDLIAGVVRSYGAKGRMDATGLGDVIFNDLERMGIEVEPVVFTAPAKKKLIDDLIVTMEQNPPGITFPPIRELVGELKAFEYSETVAGNVRLLAPVGHHDDCVTALALANQPSGSKSAVAAALLVPGSGGRYRLVGSYGLDGDDRISWLPRVYGRRPWPGRLSPRAVCRPPRY